MPGRRIFMRWCAWWIFALAAGQGCGAAGAQLRGLWVDSFHPGFRNRQEVTQLVARARAGGFNALFVEVRRRGDVFYASAHEPLAEEVEPGTDPLRTLLEVARADTQGPRLEVHAWMVSYPVWNQSSRPPSQTNHPFLVHRDWLTRSRAGAVWDGANYAWDPGLPEVQEHVFRMGMEVVRSYDVDGLHLDYIRYTGPEWGYHPRVVARFNRAMSRSGLPSIDDAAWKQFRRDQVTAVVRRLYLHLRSEKPGVTLSAATIGFAPGITNSVQWPSSAAFSHVLQDWRAWMEEGILDWNVPMLYFRETTDAQEFTRWLRFVRGHQYRRGAAAGVAFYLNPVSGIRSQIERSVERDESLPPLMGVSAYSYANMGLAPPVELGAEVAGSGGDWSEWTTSLWAGAPSIPPARPWKSDSSLAHLMGYVRRTNGGEPVDGAEVVLVSADARLRVTDACGFYGFVDVEPGRYQLRYGDGRGRERTIPVTLRGGEVASADLEFPEDELDDAVGKIPAGSTPERE